MSQTAASLDTVRLPRAVRERSERIRKMTEPPAPPAADDANPPADPPALAAPDLSSPPAATPPPAPPVDPRHLDPAYWEQRFRVTQGIVEREREQRVTAEKALRDRITTLEQELRAARATTPTPSKIDLTAFFTQDQITQYGEDQLETIASVALKAARDETQQAIAAAIEPIQRKAADDAAEQERRKREAFTDALAELVPDFEAVDATDGWKQWLAEEDEATGLVRQEQLTGFVRAHRADRVARMFKAYKATLAAPPAPPVTPRGRGGPPDSSVTQGQPALGYPTKEEIREHYKLAALNKRTPQQVKDFEARLQLPRPA